MAVMVLPGKMTTLEVYNDYYDSFLDSSAAAAQVLKYNISSEPLAYSAFIRFSDRGHPGLRDGKGGSYFCEFGTKFQNDLFNIDTTYPPNSCLSELLQRHSNYLKK